MTQETASALVAKLGERTGMPCTNPDCQSGIADLKVHYCDSDESCCEGCRTAEAAGQALLELKSAHFGPVLKALEKQRDKAKWAWQFVSAVASDNHNRQHNLGLGRTEPLYECAESICRNWCDDLDNYKATISDSEKALAAVAEAAKEAQA